MGAGKSTGISSGREKHPGDRTADETVSVDHFAGDKAEWISAIGGRQRYRPYLAYNRYLQRRMKCRRKKIFDDRVLWEKVVKHIAQDRRSPEQISNRLRLEGSPYRLSHTTIYRALRVAEYETKAVLKQARNITFHLRHRGKKRRKGGVSTIGGISQSCIICRIDVRPRTSAKRSATGKPIRSWGKQARAASWSWWREKRDIPWPKSDPTKRLPQPPKQWSGCG